MEQAFGLKWSLMALIGLLLGFTLSFSGFGIVFGWREMISKGNSYYVRTHLITIFIEIVLFTLCLSFSHALFGGKMTGNIMPVGIRLLWEHSCLAVVCSWLAYVRREPCIAVVRRGRVFGWC
ncbi:hypothetical protein PCI56_26985 [Plesiomonas shigelloides subsp. oncorhynchi]|nr:hypothetical protein [Plesiomonas shigelloides]